MKQSHEWDEKDILHIIRNQVEENIHLDYKATASLQKTEGKKNEVSKDVSSFANSAGGTIIYGVAQYADESRKRLPEKIDVGYDPHDISKEWLEQVINSRIQPRIDGIRINPIHLATTSPEKVIYALWIPESFTAHQASDFRYYKRFNFESVPMEDYELRLVMNKTRYPLLVPNFGFKTKSRNQQAHVYRLKVDLTNKGMVRAIDIAFHMWWPIGVSVQSHGIQLRSIGTERIDDSMYQHFVIEVFGSTRVIFPTEVFPLIPSDEGPYHLEYLFNQDTFEKKHLMKVRWRLHAADAPPLQGEADFTQLNEF